MSSVPSRIRPRRVMMPLVVLLSILLLLAGMASPAQARSAKSKPGKTATAPPPPAVPRSWGIAAPGLPQDVTALSALTQVLGSSPDRVMWYDAWSNGTVFPAASAQTIAASGATVEVTWEPWDPAAGLNQPAYADARIAGGAFDVYLKSYAASVKAYGRPVVLRFAHEMNGQWYPWSVGINGNTATSYIAAFRHVHDVFVAQGVTNVTWAWTPNVPYAGSSSLAAAYPGDAYVDQVGLDGYNWGTSGVGTTWQSFASIFGTGLTQLRSLTTKPVWLGEVASTEKGGDKATWIRDMFATIALHPEIVGFTWFDFNKETDWRIDSSTSAASAFRTGLGTY